MNLQSSHVSPRRSYLSFFFRIIAWGVLQWIPLHGLLAQNDEIGVFIPRDENSPFTGPKKHMWVDFRNAVISTQIGVAEFIEVWTDNGHADQPGYYSPDYCTVTPAFEGEVHVYARQRVLRGNEWDTITTTNTFLAINQPEIRLVVLHDSLAQECDLDFFLADKYKMTPVGERYRVAHTYVPIVFDRDFRMIGELPSFKCTHINCSDANLPFRIEKGYKIVVKVMVRDMETDLLIPADEWVHVVE